MRQVKVHGMPESLSAFLRDYPGYPFFQVLPMGFSWAFHLAHRAHHAVAERAPGHPAPRLGRACERSMPIARSAVMLYADNGNYLSVTEEEADAQRSRVSEALNGVG